jgi:PUA domain protein
MFIEIRDMPVMPTLRLLHRYPFMMPHMQCDKGAIKHILSGSDVMCPGLTSPGGKMEEVSSGAVVAIMAEGKEHAMGIGFTAMSTKDIRNENKGIALTLVQFLNDGMWKLTLPKL